jgi:hypothetical protein
MEKTMLDGSLRAICLKHAMFLILHIDQQIEDTPIATVCISCLKSLQPDLTQFLKGRRYVAETESTSGSTVET